MIKATIDESGTHDKAPCICVAACLGENMVQWTQFSREWAPRAAKYPKGFHSTAASDYDKAVLANLIERWGLIGYAISISYDDFNTIVTRRLRSRFGAEYVTALRVIALVLREHCEANEIDRISWVLEHGHREQKGADRFLSGLEDRGDFRIWAHKWAPKADITTHPADLVAHLAAGAFEGKKSPLLDVIKRRMQVRHFERHELAETVANGEKMMEEERREKARRRLERRHEREAAPDAFQC